jgi:CheY-like chemotaxis protein
MKLVLIVEDEYGTAQALALLLESEGFEARIAANGRAALERIAERRPDLIVTDYMMPIMNGAQLCRALRASGELAAVPVIMASSAEEGRVRQDFDGFDGFLRKPYDAKRLMRLVTALLARPTAAPARPSGGTGDPAGPRGRDGDAPDAPAASRGRT